MPKTIPDSHANRLTFFTALNTVITDNASVLGFDAPRMTEIGGILQPLVDSYTALVDSEQTVTEKNANASVIFDNQKSKLQSLIEELRASPKCSGELLASMSLIASTATRNPADIKPRLKAKAEAGHVRIEGTKDYAELINVYMRRLGQSAWIQVGHQRKRFPFDDQTPLSTPGVPEVREYMGRGVINDEEVGSPSDIVTATYAG